jgi:hypothetical protein
MESPLIEAIPDNKKSTWQLMKSTYDLLISPRYRKLYSIMILCGINLAYYGGCFIPLISASIRYSDPLTPDSKVL